MSGGPEIQPDVATSVRQLNHLRAQAALQVLIHLLITNQGFGAFALG
jgi:hypothetical protein